MRPTKLGVAGCCPETSGGGTGSTTIPDCVCDPVPSSLSMTSINEDCNYRMFQSCSIVYGPTPEEYSDLDIGVNSFLSVESFPDPIGGGALFRYLLTCSSNQWNLSRVYADSPYGSPFRDALLFQWIINGMTNSCSPGPPPTLNLTNGVPYVGSDEDCSASNTVTIMAASP